MSWKLTKKLKETHLAPAISNPFSRSSSTSTIVPSDGGDTPTTPEGLTRSATLDSDPKGKDLPPPVDVSPQGGPPQQPGIVIVTLHEGQNIDVNARDLGEFEAAAGIRKKDDVSRPKSKHTRSRNERGTINKVPTNHGRYSTKHLPYAMIDFDKHQVFVNGVSGTPSDPLWPAESTQYKFDVERPTEIGISLYLRNPKAPTDAGRKVDFECGSGKLFPLFEHGQAPDPTNATSEAPRGPARWRTGTHWVPLSWVDPNDNFHEDMGQVKIGIEFVENRQRSLTTEDFDLLKVVGKGSFGKVMQVRKKDTNRIYALKTIRKQHIINRAEVSHTLAERYVLARINNPFIVPLKFSFQSKDKLYLVLAFVNGGELFYHLQQTGKFHANRARFYTAELLCALECLHGFNVVYRDLKPENILLDYSGHIALCDFGLCKADMKDGDRTNTFCGTPEYLAPELLNGPAYSKTVDWWTLGVLLYEMLHGLPPFYSENTNEMYRKILTAPLEFPNQSSWPPEAVDLLKKLLDRRPEERLGARGAEDIKAHPFFAGIDWRKLLARKYEPMFKPNVSDQLDTTNFDSEFTSEAPTDSYVEGPMLSQTAQDQFAGWSYTRPVAGLDDAGGSVKDPSFGSVIR